VYGLRHRLDGTSCVRHWKRSWRKWEGYEYFQRLRRRRLRPPTPAGASTKSPAMTRSSGGSSDAAYELVRQHNRYHRDMDDQTCPYCQFERSHRERRNARKRAEAVTVGVER